MRALIVTKGTPEGRSDEGSHQDETVHVGYHLHELAKSNTKPRGAIYEANR
jgi:hypothetical protein